MHETSALVVVSQYVRFCLHIQKRANTGVKKKGGRRWLTDIWNKEEEDTGGEEERQ